MPKTMIDIGEFRAQAKKGEAAPAVRFTTISEPVSTSDSRTFSFVFSDESVDRYGDIIHAQGWDLKNFNANPVALFGHDAGSVENVIGRAKNVRVQGSQLVGDIEFMPADVNPNAEAVCRMVAAGYLKTVSVGFAPIAWEAAKDKSRPGGVDFKKSELLEISIVPIPANPNALVQAKAAGIEIERLGLVLPAPGALVERGLGRYVIKSDDHLTAEQAARLKEQWEEWAQGKGDTVLILDKGFEIVDLAAAASSGTTTRDAPKITRKGLYSVSFLASILADLGYLQDSVAWEAECEGDGSPVPAALMDAMKALGKVLIDMTAEEVAELVAGEDEDDLESVISMSADGVRLAAIKSIVRLDEGAAGAILATAVAHAQGKRVTISVDKAAPVPLVRSGKAISAANEKKLREAHGHMTAAAECVKCVVDPDEENPEDDPNADDEEKALRERKAAALKRKLALANA